jgi:hypothetical protein
LGLHHARWSGVPCNWTKGGNSHLCAVRDIDTFDNFEMFVVANIGPCEELEIQLMNRPAFKEERNTNDETHFQVAEFDNFCTETESGKVLSNETARR